MTHVEAGLIEQAAEALKTGQRTFGGLQVAVLIELAFISGFDRGREQGHDEALQDLHDALRRALGGDDATTMREATTNHLRALAQKQARDEADRTALEPRPHGLRLDDPDWPPVTVPGTKPTSRCPATAASTTTRAAA